MERTLAGRKTFYVSLRRRVPNGRNRAYLSYRQARLEIKSSQRKIGEWFRELEHYGFIVLAQHVSLGVDKCSLVSTHSGQSS